MKMDYGLSENVTGSAANKPYRCPGCDQPSDRQRLTQLHGLMAMKIIADIGITHVGSKRNNRRPRTEAHPKRPSLLKIN
jgi:transposase